MKYFFILTKNLVDMNLLGDLKKSNDVEIHAAGHSYPNGFWGHLVSFIMKFFPGKISSFFADVRKINLSTKESNCFIVESGALRIYGMNLIKKKKAANVRLCLLLLNSMNASSPNVVAVKDVVLNYKWDAVFTYDREDAEKYGWTYFGMNYFSTPPQITNKAPYSDAYFVGGLKGNRDRLILDCFEKLKNGGSSAKFDLYCYSDEQLQNARFKKEINYYREWKSYEYIQSHVATTNCIIEILQEGQKTQSVRYFEAIYYNKKLLTNNPKIFDLPYYDSRFMKYFESARDIDVAWVMEKEEIDYGYKGEFSPRVLLSMIEKTIAG